MFWHIDTDIVGLIVICVLYYSTRKMLRGDKYSAQNTSFLWCLAGGIFMTAVDIAASIVMDVTTSAFMYHIFMTLYLLAQELMMVAWFHYALTIIYRDDNNERRRLSIAVWGLYAVYALLVLSNPWSGLFFTLGPNMEYTRGILFLPAMVGLYYIYVVALIALIIARKKNIPSDYPWIVLLLQPIILSIAIPAQLLNPGWLVIFPAYMICLVLAFLFFQNLRFRTDRAQLHQMAEVVENFSCGMAICTISKENHLQVDYISEGLARICETDAPRLREMFNEDMLTGIHPKERDMFRSRLLEIIHERKNDEITYRCITSAGNIVWLNLRTQITQREDGSATLYATFTDLTDQKKAEQLADVALKNTGVSIWQYDFERKCIVQYQNSEEMHGFETVVPDVPNSLVESGFVHPDSAAAFIEMYDKLFAGAPFAEGVFRVQTSDRKGWWYEHIRYTNGFDKQGRPSRAVGMSTDETEKQEAIAKYERELELKHTAEMEENLLVYARFDLTTGDTLEYRFRDGTIVPPEDRTAFDYGETNAELIIDEQERAAFLALNNKENLLKRFYDGENEFRIEYRRMLPAGTAVWVRNTLHLLRDPVSGDVLLFEYWYNIETEKMRELMFRSIATDNYDFVARIDGKTRQFDVIAKAGLTYHMPPRTGEDADAVTMSLYNDCVVAEDRDFAIQNALVANVHKNLQERGRFVYTYRMRQPDGTLRDKRVTQYYIDRQREIIVMMREDVTDLIREESEKTKMLSDALAEANEASQAKSHFLSRVSHELRTPLNAIIGFMELARDADSERRETYIINTDAAAKQLLSIINDVLDVSSIESGRFRVTTTPFEFKSLISNLVELYAPQFAQKNLGFKTKLLTPVDDYLIGDPLRVNQILFNLLNNALKFTSYGGVVLKISQRQAQGDRVIVRFEVSDTGCGISQRMQERLFTPFEQESALTGQKYGGNGLGLYIVGNLVGMMDGAIRVKSEQGEGSTFTVDLPFTRAEQTLDTTVREEKPSAPVQEKDYSSMRVMLAEDNAMNRMVAENLIEKMFGVTCDYSEDGKIALAKFLDSPTGYYDIILMDIQMPNMDGYEATRQIRSSSHPDATAVQIIALTANASDDDVKKSLSNGMNAHVAKPIEPVILRSAMEKGFDMRRRRA